MQRRFAGLLLLVLSASVATAQSFTRSSEVQDTNLELPGLYAGYLNAWFGGLAR